MQVEKQTPPDKDSIIIIVSQWYLICIHIDISVNGKILI